MSFGMVAASYFAVMPQNGSSVYEAAVMAHSPLLYWRLNDASGTIATDSSGNGRDGSYINEPSLNLDSLLADGDGRSVYFDSDQHERVRLATDPWMSATEITMTCMYLWSDSMSGIEMLVSRYWDDTSDVSWFLYRQDNEFKFWYRSTGGQTVSLASGAVGEMGNIYFVAAYAGPSGAGIRVYSWGGLVSSATGAGYPVNASSRPFVVAGCDSVTDYVQHGAMQEVAYFGSVLSTGDLDSLAAYATASQPQWLNRVAGVAARNGTNSHMLTFSAASTGSFLVAVISGSTTSTAMTPGWTKRLGPMDSSECVVLTRNANAGDTSLQLAHDDSNYPINYVIYEFPSGTSWLTGAGANGSTPDLTGLPDAPVTVFAGFSVGCDDLSNPAISTVWNWRWFEDLDTMTPHNGVTAGVYMTLGWRRGVVGTSISPATTGFYDGPVYTITNSFGYRAAVTFALSIP